jgi:hypothetical protein
MVVRSLLAALGVVWVTGVLVGWAAVRRELVWPVWGSVVVAVDMNSPLVARTNCGCLGRISQVRWCCCEWHTSCSASEQLLARGASRNLLAWLQD